MAKHRDGYWFAHGKRVKSALIQEIGGRRVRVAIEEYDKYGRAVGTVTSDGRDIGEWLVREGHAIAAYSDRYTHVEREARDAGRGMWGHAVNIDPRAWRRGQGDPDLTPRYMSDPGSRLGVDLVLERSAQGIVGIDVRARATVRPGRLQGIEASQGGSRRKLRLRHRPARRRAHSAGGTRAVRDASRDALAGLRPQRPFVLGRRRTTAAQGPGAGYAAVRGPPAPPCGRDDASADAPLGTRASGPHAGGTPAYRRKGRGPPARRAGGTPAYPGGTGRSATRTSS